jgi:predicted RNA-binding protein YlxR (DUF448 family)
LIRPRKPAIRTCTGCGTSTDKREIVRFVRTPDGTVELDVTGKANGRGAYVCARLDCFETAVRKRRLSSSLRVHLTEDDMDRLRADLERHLDEVPLVIEDGDV